MTSGAQQALRRTMEIYSHTTRFALACNQSTKIIEPIQSRCAVVRYSKISDVDVLRRLLVVCDKEKVAYNDEGLEAIIFTADGDMRQALNNLQATHRCGMQGGVGGSVGGGRERRRGTVAAEAGVLGPVGCGDC